MDKLLMVLWGAATASGWWACAWWNFSIALVTALTIVSTTFMVAWII